MKKKEKKTDIFKYKIITKTKKNIFSKTKIYTQDLFNCFHVKPPGFQLASMNSIPFPIAALTSVMKPTDYRI